MPTLLLSPLIALAALMAIWGDRGGRRWQHYVGKPLATLLIIGLAFAHAPHAPRGYALAILVGLLCSLAGDIFLMLPGDRFIAGLVAFLLAHLAYSVAFASAPGAAIGLASLLTLLPLALYSGLVFRSLAPHLGRLRPPVLIYLLAIVAMAWLALDRWRATGATGAGLAAAGALIFVISDTLLARNRFVGRFDAAQPLILGTYFAARWLIALSLR